MKLFITYLLLVLGVLSMEINLFNADVDCSICFESFNQSSRKQIILHKVNKVNHTFCKNCVMSLMKETLTRCPNCRYELNLQEKNHMDIKLFFLNKEKYLKIGIKFGLTILNLVLPALLTVDKGFFMEILHFALRGSTHIIIALPMTIANGVLLFLKHNQLMVNDVMGEAIGEADVSFWNPSILSTGVMIALPAFMEIVRGGRGLSFMESFDKRASSESPGMVTVFDLFNTIMPTFLQPFLFFPLFVLSQLVQLEVETVYLLFAANIASIFHNCHPATNYPYVDITKIYVMIVFASLRGCIFAGPYRKHFTWFLLVLFVLYMVCSGDMFSLFDSLLSVIFK